MGASPCIHCQALGQCGDDCPTMRAPTNVTPIKPGIEKPKVVWKQTGPRSFYADVSAFAKTIGFSEIVVEAFVDFRELASDGPSGWVARTSWHGTIVHTSEHVVARDAALASLEAADRALMLRWSPASQT